MSQLLFSENQVELFGQWIKGLEKQVEDEKFDMTTFAEVEQTLAESPEQPCLTAGCAVGYLPVIFPEDWMLYRHSYVATIMPALRREPRRAVDETMSNAGLGRQLRSYFGLPLDVLTTIMFPSQYFGKTRVSRQRVISRMRLIHERMREDPQTLDDPRWVGTQQLLIEADTRRFYAEAAK